MRAHITVDRSADGASTRGARCAPLNQESYLIPFIFNYFAVNFLFYSEGEVPYVPCPASEHSRLVYPRTSLGLNLLLRAVSEG